MALVVALAVAASACTSTDPGAATVPTTVATTTTAAIEEGPGLSAAVQDVLAEVGDADEPGCAAGVARDGEVLYAGGHGVADLAAGRPLDEDTTFDIASVSKQFTAAAVVLLVADGELDLDDDVREYVPELPDRGVTVTLEQLLHHTGGLPEYTELLAEDFDDTDVTTTEQALDAVVAAPASGVEPGTVFEYSNTGYFLLALVASRVAGVPFRELVADRLFTPLAMDASDVRDDADLHVPDGAEGYVVEDGDFGPGTTNWEQVGDGAVWSSVTDLLRWADNLQTFAVGGEALREGLLTPGPVPDEEGFGYGGGLTIGDGIIEHSGGWAGFSSDLLVEPATGTAVVVLCNRDDPDPYDLAERILTLA